MNRETLEGNYQKIWDLKTKIGIGVGATVGVATTLLMIFPVEALVNSTTTSSEQVYPLRAAICLSVGAIAGMLGLGLGIDPMGRLIAERRYPIDQSRLPRS